MNQVLTFTEAKQMTMEELFEVDFAYEENVRRKNEAESGS